MTVSHHLDHATLMSYASGALGEALCIVVTAHLEMCPRCREEARRLNVLGGVILEQAAPTKIERDMNSTMKSLPSDVLVAAPPPSKRAQGDVPYALQDRLDVPLDDVSWSWLAPGVSTHQLPLSGKDQGDLRLLRVEPGVTVPEHSHGGSELTLILRGAYTDCFGRFGPGDVADFDEECTHQPVVDTDEACICLVASEAPARFTGLLARLMQPLTGM